MAERFVQCAKLGKQARGLDAPPFPDDLGKEIYEHVSAEVWTAWRDDMMIKVINEYRLNLAEPDHYAVLIEQMRAFLGLGGNVLEVGNADRGKSG